MNNFEEGEIQNSYEINVKNSDVPYILIKYKNDLVSLIAKSNKVSNIIIDILDLINSGVFVAYIKTLEYLKVGKTLTEIGIYKKQRIEFYGEVLSPHLFLIQLNTQEYLNDLNTSTLYNPLLEKSSIKTKEAYNLIKNNINALNKLNRELTNKVEVLNQGDLSQQKNIDIINEKLKAIEKELLEVANLTNNIKNNPYFKFATSPSFTLSKSVVTAIVSVLVALLTSLGFLSLPEKQEPPEKISNNN